MPDLHYPTLLAALAVVTLLSTLMIGVAAALSHGAPEGRLWAAGNLTIGAGFGLTAAEQMPLVVHAVLGYGVLALGQGLMLAGFWTFVGRRPRMLMVVTLGLVGLLVPAFFAFVEPSQMARQASAALLAGLVCSYCCVWLLRQPAQLARGATLVTAIAFGLVALLVWSWLFGEALPSLLQVPHTLWGGLPAGLFTAGAMLVAQVTVLAGLMLMLAQRHAGVMEQAALTDALTGIHNRAGFQELARRRLDRARQSGKGLALMLVDVDHFKRVNDNHGHAVGDEVLRFLVRRSLRALRPEDLIGRWGGEEFAVLMVGVNPVQAREAAERLRRKIARRAMPLDKGLALEITVSIGVAQALPEPGDAEPSLTELLRLADAALYEAKRNGRNQVRIARTGSVMLPESTLPAPLNALPPRAGVVERAS
jgi:diguanylate cyclase (GGDEF)-like protein